MASTGDVELRSHSYQVLRKRWEITGRDDEIYYKFRNNESMQGVRRLQVACKIQEWKKINGGRFEDWSALRCENDYKGHHILTRLAKTLIKHDVWKQQISNFKKMTSGHYVSI